MVKYDFPGGWKSDERSAFKKNERTDDENELVNYISTILKWRKNAIEIHKGKLKHYKPINNVYVYFRYYEDEKTMLIINNNNQIKELNLNRFNESLQGFNSGVDIIKNENIDLSEKITINPNTALIVKLKK